MPRFDATSNPSVTLSPSIDFPVEPVNDLPCSDDFSSGRGGLLQLLGMSLSPCCRFHPAEVLEPHRSDFGSPCCLSPPVGGSAFGATHFRGHFCVHCCYGPVTVNRHAKGTPYRRPKGTPFVAHWLGMTARGADVARVSLGRSRAVERLSGVQ